MIGELIQIIFAKKFIILELLRTKLKIKEIEDDIIDQYLYDESERPWIIGFSGGKDSTLLLQLVWNSLKKLEDFHLKRKVYIVCNNTLVENPKILSFIEKTLDRIKIAALKQNLANIEVHKTYPKIEDSFWVKLIGLGYPAPNKFYRWCTERLKINPTSRFILDKVNENGEAIILLGTRHDESVNRSNSIKKHEIFGQRLNKHQQLPNTYIYTPIKYITTNELWQYLLQNPPPWGGTHRELITLYKNAQGGDCPLVIDNNTPSCGNSRFGCWTCTVVNKDKSMEGLIDSGEEWMLPLLELRDFLITTRDNPEKYRFKQRRNGKEEENKWGPYNFETRVEILSRLLHAQKNINKIEPIQLISHQELILIQYHWFRDLFFKIKVSEIYYKIYQEKNYFMEEYNLKNNLEKELLQKTLRDNSYFEVILDLINLNRTKSLLIRKHGLQTDIENRLEEFLKVKNLDSNNYEN